MAEEEKVVNTAEATTAEATEQGVTETDTTVTETVTPPAEEKPEGRANERIRELNERVKNAEEQTRIALNTIQQMQQNAQRPNVPEPETEYLDPAVKKLADENKQLKALGGALVDKMDLLEVQTNPDIKNYKKYAPNIDQLRQQRAGQGQYISRLQAYYEIKGQEALRGGNRQTVVEKEPETPAAIPQTKTAVKQTSRLNKPETLEEKIARLKDVPI